MKLEQPRVQPTGDLAARVAYLEAYLYRLHGELTAVLNAMGKEETNAVLRQE